MKTDKKNWRQALLLLRIFIPLGLLAIIFLNIDLHALARAFLSVKLPYLFISILFANFAQVLGGATRWYYLVRTDYRRESLLNYIQVYWAAMFYGYFLPSNIGMDVYRLAAMGKKLRNYERHLAILIGEKFYTLLFSMAVLFGSYMVVFYQIEHSEVAGSLNVLAVLFIVFSFIAIIIILFFRRRLSVLLGYFKKRLYRYAQAITQRLPSGLSFQLDSFIGELPYTMKKNFFVRSFIFTLLLKISLAIGGYFLFLSLGIELSFWALLFANSVFFVLFLLPISFGSLGVREGAYIIVYGLFGVPAETALAASFLALAGLLFTIAIGGIISLTQSFHKIISHHGE